MIETTDTRNVPGHRDAGARAWHRFGGGCLECEAHALRWLSLAEAEQLHRAGVIDDPWFRAYMWAWTTWVSHSGEYGDWTPRDEETWTRVGELEDAYGRPRRRFPIGPRRYGKVKYAGCVETASFNRTINGVPYAFAYRRVILSRRRLSIVVRNGVTGEVVHRLGAPFEPQGPAAES